MDRSNFEDLYPLSPLQKGFLFHSLEAPDEGTYVVQLHCRLRGEVDADAFERAWQRVVDRHPALRTSFLWRSVDPMVQIVHRDLSISLQRHDWSGREEGEALESDLDAFLQAERAKGFALDTPPLMRFHLIEAADAHHFVWVVHHALVDGWCTPLITRELFVFYDAFARGDDLVLDAPTPYRKYVEWVHRQDDAEAQRFWESALDGVDQPTSLPFVAAPAAGPADNREHQVFLSEDATERLTREATAHGLTLNTLVQGAWSLLLGRLTDADDVLYGVTVSGRTADVDGVDGIVGPLLNTLPARVSLRPQATVQDWLGDLQTHLSAVRSHGYVSLPTIREWSALEPGVALFESTVVFENYPQGPTRDADAVGLQIEQVRSREQTNYPLYLSVQPGPRLSIRLLYRADRVPPAEAERLVRYFQQTLASLVESMDKPLHRVEILDAHERDRILNAWNDPDVAIDDRPAPDRVAEHVASTPDAVAVAGPDGQHLTYGALWRSAGRLARRLRTRSGVGPDRCVAVLMRRSPRLIASLLGVWRAGGAYVPINPEYPDARIRYILEDSGAVAVVTDTSLVDRLPDDLDLDRIALSDTFFLDALRGESGAPARPADGSENGSKNEWANEAAGESERESERDPETDPAIDPAIDPQQLAYVAYTSGSTGQPKGVMLPQGVVGGFFDSMTKRLDVDADDVWLFFHNYAFDVSVWEIWGALTAGGRLEVVPDAERRDPSAVWLRTIQRRVTALAQTPSAFASLTSAAARRLGRSAPEPDRRGETPVDEADRRPDAASPSAVETRSGDGAPASGSVPAPVPADDLDLSALRYVVFTGEALRTQHVRTWFDHFGALPAQLVNSLGTTETAVYTSYAEIDDAEPESDDGEGTLVGRGLPGEILTVRDAHLRVQPPGVPGEIAIAGCGLARGYRGKPRQTASSFVPNPDGQRPGERLYLSGDRGRHRASGDVEHMGRFDDQVQIRGYRVEPGEVEAQLAEIEGVEHAAVLAVPSRATTPGGSMQLVAYIVGAADPEAVRAEAAERLWHVMVPAVVESIDAMPLTPNGKLDYRALPSVRPVDADEYVAPRTETEEIVASIWSDVLGVDDVGVTTDFFRLGGNSITAIQIAGRVEDAFGTSIALRQLLSRTTVEEVAEHVETQLLGTASDDDLEDLLETI